MTKKIIGKTILERLEERLDSLAKKVKELRAENKDFKTQVIPLLSTRIELQDRKIGIITQCVCRLLSSAEILDSIQEILQHDFVFAQNAINLLADEAPPANIIRVNLLRDNMEKLREFQTTTQAIPTQFDETKEIDSQIQEIISGLEEVMKAKKEPEKSGDSKDDEMETHLYNRIEVLKSCLRDAVYKISDLRSHSTTSTELESPTLKKWEEIIERNEQIGQSK